MRRSLAAVLLVLAACSRPVPVAEQERRCARDDGMALRVPILMYHHIGEAQGRYPALWVTLERFAAQMEALARAGVATLTIQELADAVCERTTFDRGAVAITFDDGTANQRWAYSVLRAFRLKATFYVPTGKIGRPGYLTWHDLRRMRGSGLISVQPHTVTHADLPRLPADAARREIADSAREIERRLGGSARHFAYPYGKRSDAVEAILDDAGFSTAVTTAYRLAHPHGERLRWGRMAIGEGTKPGDLAALARASGTWVRAG